MRSIHKVFAVAGVLYGTACNFATDSSNRADLLTDAFASIPYGFSSTENTFTTSAEGTWAPGPMGAREASGPHGGGMMGGGLRPDFFGGVGFGPGLGRGPFGEGVLPSTCTFVASTGRVTCPTETVNGLTINRWAKYTNAAGQVQSAYDTATTNTVQSHADVSGTTTRKDRHDSTSTSTSTVSHVSDRTVTGLASASTKRTVNGTSAGSENTNGTNSKGQFTAVRAVGDTTTGLVIPVPTASGSFPYPTAGTVIRHMRATVTYAGQSPTNSERREVITYDGSATAKIVITQDGTTKTCALPLPHGRPSCS